jgi:hypothetical protein
LQKAANGWVLDVQNGRTGHLYLYCHKTKSDTEGGLDSRLSKTFNSMEIVNM